MFEKMRRIFGPVAVTVIIGSIALVFIFYGVYNPRTTRGMQAGAVAATVNGSSVSLEEFSREYQQRMQYFQELFKGKAPDPKLLEQLGVKNQVLEELVRRKLVTQEAERMGLTVSDAEVKAKIQDLPYFKREGKFDLGQYQKLLQANRIAPATFEDSVREDLVRSKVNDFIRDRATVSNAELMDEYLYLEERRQVDYVVIPKKYILAKIEVPKADLDGFFKNEENLKAAKKRYEQDQYTEYQKPKAKKPKVDAKAKAMPPMGEKEEFYAFDEVKDKIALTLLRERHSADTIKIGKEVADQLLAKAKTSGLAAAAKAMGLTFKTSEKFNREQSYFDEIGQPKDLISDAFAPNSTALQSPKSYMQNGVYLIATNLKVFHADAASFEKNKSTVADTMMKAKEQSMYETWMKDLRQRAKVSMNETLLNSKASADEE